ncbi:MAG TPA: hemerythrin domain-containing protein [Nocardioides sp.]|nr:hemerythrin domain-containing protein [Nocardioides sp.]
MSAQESTPTAVVDISAMPAIHTFFRREFRLAGGLVRGVAEGDRARSAVVADHVDFLQRSLHEHHSIEDELVWPLLLGRVPEELASIVHLMESQHQRVDALVEEIGVLLPVFRSGAGTAERDRLADLLDTLYVHLVEHLDAEEERLLPIAARTMTQQEWDALGHAGRARGRKSEMTLFLGMVQHDGDPAGFAGMLAEAPPPVRWLLPKLARRRFRKHALRVHGTATP